MHSAFSSPSLGWFLPFSTRHTLVSCFKKRKETSLTPPPGQSYLLLPLQGHFQGVVCTACGRVLTSHSLLLGLLFGFQLHQSGETSGSKSAAISRPLLSRATSWSLPRAAASPGPRAGAPGVTSFRELTPLAPGSPAPRSWVSFSFSGNPPIVGLSQEPHEWAPSFFSSTFFPRVNPSSSWLQDGDPASQSAPKQSGLTPCFPRAVIKGTPPPHHLKQAPPPLG